MEIIDRGGLYHISDDDVQLKWLFASISTFLVSRRMYLGLTSKNRCMIKYLIGTNGIVTCWEHTARDIPRKYEKYSVELLGVVTDLWITIQGSKGMEHYV